MNITGFGGSAAVQVGMFRTVALDHFEVLFQRVCPVPLLQYLCTSSDILSSFCCRKLSRGSFLASLTQTVYILINVDVIRLFVFSSKVLWERKRNIEEIDLSLNNSYIYKRGIKLFALQREWCKVSLLLLWPAHGIDVLCAQVKQFSLHRRF